MNRLRRPNTPEKNREYNARRTMHARRVQNLRQYGLTVAQYDKLLEQQDGVCAICKKPEFRVNAQGKILRLAIDYCHEGQHVRGLLCGGCNIGLGSFKDSIKTLQIAIKYLKDDNEKIFNYRD